MTESLTEGNFILYAAKYYDNPQCHDIEEFHEDLNRFKYIKRLFNKYKETGILKERHILNHLTVIYNVFGTEAATKMLFFKLKTQHSLLKPFLVLLGTLPEHVHGIIDNKPIHTSEIVMDSKIVNILRKI